MGIDRVRGAEPWHLVRKVILLLLLVLALSLGLVLLQRRGSPAPLLLFNVLADASIGLVIGLGTRALFRRRPWLIKALVSAALSIVGLAFLGVITGSQSGIGPLRADFVEVNWLRPVGYSLRFPTPPRKSETDVLDAAHMLIAMDVSWLALRAWAKSGPAPERRAARLGGALAQGRLRRSAPAPVSATWRRLSCASPGIGACSLPAHGTAEEAGAVIARAPRCGYGLSAGRRRGLLAQAGRGADRDLRGAPLPLLPAGRSSGMTCGARWSARSATRCITRIVGTSPARARCRISMARNRREVMSDMNVTMVLPSGGARAAEVPD